MLVEHMSHVSYLPEALDDLHAIWRYIYEQSRSIEIADRLIETIDDTARTYARRPEIGAPRPELDSRVRCFPVGRYVVFYISATDGIEVAQIIHGSRDLPRHWRGVKDP